MGNGGRPFSPITATCAPTVGQEPNHYHYAGKNRAASIPDGYSQQPQLPPQPYSANVLMAQNGQMGDGASPGHHYFPVSPGSGSAFSPAAGDTGNLQQFSPPYAYPPIKTVTVTVSQPGDYATWPWLCDWISHAHRPNQ